MISSVYMQSGQTTAENLQIDPDNLLLWRRPARRLEAEVIRDALLSVSGKLKKRMFGKGSLSQEDNRRSIYLTVKRSRLIPILQLFDAPDSIQSIGHRNVTTVPPQALAMMNSPFARQLAEKFAKRVRPKADVPLDKVVSDAYWIALSRDPSETEQSRTVAFVEAQTTSHGGNGPAVDRAVADFCQMMLSLNEFLFID